MFPQERYTFLHQRAGVKYLLMILTTDTHDEGRSGRQWKETYIPDMRKEYESL